MKPSQPIFRKLSRQESEAILARNHVGRLAYARANQVDIEPVHYVYADGWIYGRTSVGKKLEMTGYTWWPVAFEVDEVEELFRWRSVVVHGGFYTLAHLESHGDDLKRAVEALRTLLPETFTDNDPVAFRNIIFRVAVQEIFGREAVPNSSGEE